MLNPSQLGNMLFVAPAIVAKSSWTEKNPTTKCADIAICGFNTTFGKESNEVGWEK